MIMYCALGFTPVISKTSLEVWCIFSNLSRLPKRNQMTRRCSSNVWLRRFFILWSAGGFSGLSRIICRLSKNANYSAISSLRRCCSLVTRCWYSNWSACTCTSRLEISLRRLFFRFGWTVGSMRNKRKYMQSLMRLSSYKSKNIKHNLVR